MADDMVSSDIRVEWQNQNREAFRMSADEIRQRIEKVNAEIYGRNRGIRLIASIVGYLSIVFFISALMGTHDPIARIGFALVLAIYAIGLYRGVSFRRAEKAVARAAEMGNLVSADFFKGQLERLRDLHSGKWYWPNMFFSIAGLTLIGHESRVFVIGSILVGSVISLLVFRTTRKYQQQLDEINRLQQENPDRV